MLTLLNLQILEFMPTELRVTGNMVLAIVLGDIADHLRKVLVAERMGETFVVKDFLKGGELSAGILLYVAKIADGENAMYLIVTIINGYNI